MGSSQHDACRCTADNEDGKVSSVVLSDNDADTANTTITYSYDSLRRLSGTGNGIFTTTYSYHDDAETDTATPRLKSIVNSGVNYSGKTVECDPSYTYDVNGNIASISFGTWSNTFVYDSNNQLIRENNNRSGYTQTWEYDAFGNILSTSKYAYTTGELGEPTSTVTYGYTDSTWGDLLTVYNGQTIEYDSIGNPLYIKDAEGNVVKSYTWEHGRQLATHLTKGVTWTYTYDSNGLRTGRTDGTNTYEYIYAGDNLVRMIRNGEVVDFGYAGGQLATMTYDGVTYYYILNGQGDVIALTDNTGRVVIGYTYGAYGSARILLADETLTLVLKNVNPFTYRGYVYDIETTLYYLQSRYYDPELGRFINADALVSTGQGVLGNNMFAYCVNNPVNMADPTGHCSYFLFFKIDCFSTSCPTSQCYNPDAPSAVVIYDGRASGTPWWLGNDPGDEGFAHQGQELMSRLSGFYNVTGYAYTTMDDFVEIWNSLDGSYDTIDILGHGQPGKFNAIGGSLRSSDSDYSYSDLASVDVAVIYLYICNGDTLTDGYMSTAHNFANLTGANVHAVSNGKLNFTWYNCFPYIHPKYWLTGQWTTTSLD